MNKNRSICRTAATFALVNTVLFVIVGAAHAESTSNSVFVGGTPIMRVRIGGGGFTPAQRAAQIQERVNRVLSHGPIQPADISVARRGGEAVVLVKDELLLTADAATARFNRTSPLLLAQTWAENMRRVLPSLTEPK